MADPAVLDYKGVLTQVTNDYINVFAGYEHKFIHYGKEIFIVLLAINVTWIAIWYAFDKSSLAAGMSDFLKKFVVAMIFYGVMITPSYMGSLIGSSTQMGLDITGAASLDPSYIVTIGSNVAFRALSSITNLSFIFNSAAIFVTLIMSCIIIFCFISVALQVAVTQVIATALAMLSCFTLGFSALGATAGMARKSMDALFSACFKLLGYYVVIGASLPVMGRWNELPKGFFHDARQMIWLCTATLMFWLLSKSLASVFERVGGGLVGETAGVDFAALVISAAKTATMAYAKSLQKGKEVVGAGASGGLANKADNRSSSESAWGSQKSKETKGLAGGLSEGSSGSRGLGAGLAQKSEAPANTAGHSSKAPGNGNSSNNNAKSQKNGVGGGANGGSSKNSNADASKNSSSKKASAGKSSNSNTSKENRKVSRPGMGDKNKKDN